MGLGVKRQISLYIDIHTMKSYIRRNYNIDLFSNVNLFYYYLTNN